MCKQSLFQKEQGLFFVQNNVLRKNGNGRWVKSPSAATKLIERKGRRLKEGDAMKYTTENALAEIFRRSQNITAKRNKRVCQILSGVSTAVFAGIAAVIAVFPENHAVEAVSSDYGALLLSPEAGSYILLAVVAISLGAATALLIFHLTMTQSRKKSDQNQKKPKH